MNITSLVVCVLLFVLGCFVGSFLNLLISREMHGVKYFSGAPDCPHCKTRLTPKQLLPLVSFALQKGRCAHCGEKLDRSAPVVELLCGVSYVIAFLSLEFTLKLPIALVLFAVLIALAVIDIKKGEIPYWCNVAIAALGVFAFVLSFVAPQTTIWYEHIIGLFVISVPFAVLAFFGGMGGGDMMLVGTAGFLLGWAIVPGVLIAFILGAVAGVVIKLSKKTQTISFGPYLAVGIAIGFLYGNSIIEWYKMLIT